MRREIHYPNIPTELKDAAREMVKLYIAKKKIPDDTRKKANEYKRWCNNNGERPSGNIRPRLIHTEIPKSLRIAKTEYGKIMSQGEECPPELREKVNEYNRWARWGGQQPPPLQQRRRNVSEGKPYLEEYRERERLKRLKVAPGDIPKEIIEKAAKCDGKTVPKYTECSDSDKRGNGCKGRHGDGPRKNMDEPGYVYCRTCHVGYRGVPDDVIWCGCCGRQISRRCRDKSK